MVELPITLFSTLILFFSQYIVLVDLFAIFGIVSVVVFGEICFATLADAKQPQFHLLTDNIVVQNNPNISKKCLCWFTDCIFSWHLFGTIGVCGGQVDLVFSGWNNCNFIYALGIVAT